MGAVRELGAELVIARRSLVGNREADSTMTTMAMSGPSAYEQSGSWCAHEQQTIPAVLMADAQATHIQAALTAANSAGGPCRIPAPATHGVPTPGGP
eukprot:3789864-Pyramimonas_sp.AAC.1